jgi:hypothetical protein
MAVLVVARTTNDRATVVVAVIVKIVDNRALVVLFEDLSGCCYCCELRVIKLILHKMTSAIVRVPLTT